MLLNSVDANADFFGSCISSFQERHCQESTAVALHMSTIISEDASSIDVKLTSEDKSSKSSSKDTKSIHSVIQCADCHAQFIFATDLVAHSKKTRHRPFSCQYKGCGKQYTRQEHLTRHVETVHVRGTTESIEEQKPYKCELCQARFVYNHGLTRHTKRSHRNVNFPFECSACLKRFKKKSELQAHSYVHTGVLPFECEKCGERYLQRFQLTRHQRKHEANRKADTQVYVCVCGEICFDKDELKSHKHAAHHSHDEQDTADSHVSLDKEGPTYVCLVCNQVCCRKQYLRAHLRTHFESLDDRKQYICPMDGCDKAYTRSSNLMTHYNAVHDVHKSKRFVCPRSGCTARFGYKTVLKHHLESIHDNPKSPKQRTRKSASILERVLGTNQLGEQDTRVTAEISIVNANGL